VVRQVWRTYLSRSVLNGIDRFQQFDPMAECAREFHHLHHLKKACRRVCCKEGEDRRASFEAGLRRLMRLTTDVSPCTQGGAALAAVVDPFYL